MTRAGRNSCYAECYAPFLPFFLPPSSLLPLPHSPFLLTADWPSLCALTRSPTRLMLKRGQSSTGRHPSLPPSVHLRSGPSAHRRGNRSLNHGQGNGTFLRRRGRPAVDRFSLGVRQKGGLTTPFIPPPTLSSPSSHFSIPVTCARSNDRPICDRPTRNRFAPRSTDA